MTKMYKLKYLPLALKDLRETTDYIANTLKSPKAALDLLDTLDESILRIQQFPYSCKLYQPNKDLETEYRLLPIKNYAVFYVVKEQAVEIHRIIYVKRDLTKFVK